jgi:hypothetical protein
MMWNDPSQLTDAELQTALAEIEGKLRDLRSCDKLMELESRKWRLTAEQRYRQRQTRSTYFSHAGDVELELGGRFAKLTPTTVVGTEPITKYPKLESGFWAKDECPPEPPLGFDVNTQEPVGEAHELSPAKEGGSE